MCMVRASATLPQAAPCNLVTFVSYQSLSSARFTARAIAATPAARATPGLAHTARAIAARYFVQCNRDVTRFCTDKGRQVVVFN